MRKAGLAEGTNRHTKKVNRIFGLWSPSMVMLCSKVRSDSVSKREDNVQCIRRYSYVLWKNDDVWGGTNAPMLNVWVIRCMYYCVLLQFNKKIAIYHISEWHNTARNGSISHIFVKLKLLYILYYYLDSYTTIQIWG